MKAFKLLAMVGVMTAAVAGSGQTVSMDKCVSCNFFTKFEVECKAKGIKEDYGMLKTGICFYYLGKSEADATWCENQFKTFMKSATGPDAKFCEMCAPIAKFAMSKNTTYESAKTKSGYMTVMTSTNKAEADAFMAHMKKMMEMMPENKVDDGGKATVAYIGKGDGVTTCPVTGEPVNKNVSLAVHGKTVHLCCAGCLAKVKANPDAYVKH